MITTRELQFISQSDRFIEAMLGESGARNMSELERLDNRLPHVLMPTIVDDLSAISPEQKQQLLDSYLSEYGVAYFIATTTRESSLNLHPLFELTTQLSQEFHLPYPLTHPLEGHAEAVARFGHADGTVKIYNLPNRGGELGYREQAETAELFDMHHDGLGSGGTVETVILYCDQPPLFGGYTCFQNCCRLGLELARDDAEAFKAMFLPDAITIMRPRGKGAIKVSTPVLFINDAGQPQSFVRVASGEYVVRWRTDSDALLRARVFVERFCRPFAPGSSFLNFSARGHGCLIRNRVVAHSRTPFVDAPEKGKVRALSRKWYMRSARDEIYKHVPGMFVAKEYAELFPEFFDEVLLSGEWRYDASTDKNMPMN